MKIGVFYRKYFFLFLILLINRNLVSSSKAKIVLDQSDSGNWYEKLHWWKKAKPKYDEIVHSVSKVKTLQKELINKRSQFYSEFDKMFQELAIDKEAILKELNGLIDKYNLQLEEDFEEDDEAQKKEVTKLIEKKKVVEQLLRDFQVLFGLKDRLDEATLDILIDQVQLVDSYQEKALDNFEKIENVLDDKKARDLYESIENANENIKAIENYFDGALRIFINEVIAKSRQLMINISHSITELKSFGIYLSEREKKEALELAEKEEKEAEKSKKEKGEIEEVEGFSLWQKIKNFFIYLAQIIWNIIKFPFAFIYRLIFERNHKNK